MATAVGSFIKNNINQVTGIYGYLTISLAGLLQYLTHGIPEIIAYFIGALASGIISVALVNHDTQNKNFKILLKDAGSLIMIAVALLLIAGLIEVYLTPLFF